MYKFIILYLIIFDLLVRNVSGQEVRREVLPKDSKGISERCLEYKKQGFKVDAAFGTIEEQIMALNELQNENKERQKAGKDDRWIIETITAQSEDLGIAQDKARDFGRMAIGKNLGSKIEGKLNFDQHYYSSSGEDMTKEMRSAIGAFNEVFEHELGRNRIIMRLQRKDKVQEKDIWVVIVTIALDYDEFIETTVTRSSKEKFEQKIAVNNGFKQIRELYKEAGKEKNEQNENDAFKYFYQAWLIAKSVYAIKLDSCEKCDSIGDYYSKINVIIQDYFSRLKIKTDFVDFIDGGQKSKVYDEFILPAYCTLNNSVVDFLNVSQKTDNKVPNYYPLNSQGKTDIYINFDPLKEKEYITLDIVFNDNIFNGNEELIRKNDLFKWHKYLNCEIDFSRVLSTLRPPDSPRNNDVLQPKITDTLSIINDIVKCKTFSELMYYYRLTDERLFKLFFNSNEIIGSTDGCYIIVYETNDQKTIKAVLSPGKSRLNLVTNKLDEIGNYSGLPYNFLLMY